MQGEGFDALNIEQHHFYIQKGHIWPFSYVQAIEIQRSGGAVHIGAGIAMSLDVMVTWLGDLLPKENFYDNTIEWIFILPVGITSFINFTRSTYLGTTVSTFLDAIRPFGADDNC